MLSSKTSKSPLEKALKGSALLLLLAGCKNNPSGSPATTSNMFRFGSQTQQSVDQFKQQAQATAQAGNNAILAGSQDIQKSVNTQLSNLDAQRAQLTSQIQTSTGQAKQQLEAQLASLDAQRGQLANTINQSGQSFQNSVNSQLSQLDAQRAQLTSQIQSSTGQARQQLEGQLTSLNSQREQLTNQATQTGQSLQQNFQQTSDALNQSARQIQQTFTNPPTVSAPVPAAPPPVISLPTR